jgi:hypothetical protein
MRPVEQVDSAGAQVADFLLWIDRRRGDRTIKESDRNELDRLLRRTALLPDTSWQQVDGPMRASTYRKGAAPGFLGKRPSGDASHDGAQLTPGELLAWIERVVHALASAPALPRHIADLGAQLRQASATLRGSQSEDRETLATFLEAFLVVADTIPVYVEDVPASVAAAAQAIGLACEIVDERDERARELLAAWVAYRRDHPGALGW